MRVNFSWQVQYLVMLDVLYVCAATRHLKFGLLAGAQNGAFFLRKMLVATAKSNLGCKAGVD